MSILWTIIIGFVVGLLARFVMPGRDPAGFIVTTLLGIGGAVVGGFLGRAMGWYPEGHPAGFLVSIMGAVLLLMLYRLVRPSPKAVGHTP